MLYELWVCWGRDFGDRISGATGDFGGDQGRCVSEPTWISSYYFKRDRSWVDRVF